MKFLEQKKTNLVDKMRFWSGNFITKLKDNEIFVYGSNVLGIAGAGAAKAALVLGKAGGAKNLVARGMNGTSTYALVTKVLDDQAGTVENGITYTKTGFRSVTPDQIIENINQLYETAKQTEYKDKNFLISYQYETWPNGTPKKSLNGYDSQEMFEMFVKDKDIPPNIVFHESYKPHLEKLYKNQNDNKNIIAFKRVKDKFGWMSNMSSHMVVYEDIEYKSTEALFQALRYKKFPDVQKEIISQESPMQAKIVAQKYKQLLVDSGYELLSKQDIENMKLCIDLKLKQHLNLAEELLSTNDSLIIEDCTNRPEGSGLFWGSAYQDNQWVGKNTLGNILMQARDKLKLENKSNNYEFFFSLTSPFSNFYPSIIKYKEFTFISNEQFFMFSKAKVFKDETTANKILQLNLNNSLANNFLNGKISDQEIISNKDLTSQWNNLMKEIKKLGREVKNYDDKFWIEKREKNMYFGLDLKFNQNLHLKQILLNIGNKKLIEASVFDKDWGIGLSKDQALKTDEKNWPGKNLLGKSLDKLKEKIILDIKNDNNNKPIEVVNFYQINKIIPDDGVYIGRANKNFNLESSKFANPFVMKDNSDLERQRVVDDYKNWLFKEISKNNITKKDLMLLNGKKLVCYCSPKLCHGNVLKDIIELLIHNEQNFDNKINEYSTKNLKF